MVSILFGASCRARRTQGGETVTAGRAPLPAAVEWATRLDLARKGGEWCGPCPVCGGTDRFHVRSGSTGARVGCRGCIDGEPPHVRSERFGRVLRATFPERFQARDRVRVCESGSEPLSGVTACGATRPRIPTRTVAEEASRRASAWQLWVSATRLHGTDGERYLTARGVEHVAGAPALRFHPGITHRHAPGRLPALIAGVQGADGRFLGIQRTYIDGPRKAALDPVRASLGTLAGGAVRLVDPAGDALLLGEGIESTAAAMKVLEWPGGAWATLGTPGLRAVVLPESVRRVLIAADRDDNGSGQKAAAALARRMQAEGRRVECWLPSIHRDFNDELMAMEGA